MTVAFESPAAAEARRRPAGKADGAARLVHRPAEAERARPGRAAADVRPAGRRRWPSGSRRTRTSGRGRSRCAGCCCRGPTPTSAPSAARRSPSARRSWRAGAGRAGRQVFFGEQAACAKCHAVHGQGGDLGPDLSNLVHRDYASVLRDIDRARASPSTRTT